MAVLTLNWNGAPASSPDPNSCQISYAAGDSLYNTVNADTPGAVEATVFPANCVCTAIKDFLVAHGWTRLQVTGQTVGKYVFSAPNLLDSVGASSKKWIMLDFATSGKLYIKVYESITAAGVYTNLAYTSDLHFGTVSTNTTGVVAFSGKLWISATARHLLTHSYSNAVYGNQLASYSDNGPIGCFEFTRVSTLDLVSNPYPKFAFISCASCHALSALNWWAMIPRTRAGAGSIAQGGALSAYGSGGQINNTVGTPCATIMPLYLNSSMLNPVASNINLIGANSSSTVTETLGTLINYVAITRSYGAIIGDDIQIPMSADPNYGNEMFYDPTGAPMSMWLLGGSLLGQGRIAVPK